MASLIQLRWDSFATCPCQGDVFVHHQPVATFQDMLLWNVSPVGTQNGFHRHIQSVIKTIGRDRKSSQTFSTLTCGFSEECWFQQAFPVQWDVRVCIRRRSRSSAHRRIPNTHAVTDLSESQGASQIEAPNIGNTEQCSVCKTTFPKIQDLVSQHPLNGYSS